MVTEFVGADRLERARPHVEGDLHEGDTARLDRAQELGGEVQPRGRSRDRPGTCLSRITWKTSPRQTKRDKLASRTCNFFLVAPCKTPYSTPSSVRKERCCALFAFGC